MAINLNDLSPKELRTLIADAESKMHAAHSSQIQDVKQKIDALLEKSGLSMADIYPQRGSKTTGAKRQGRKPVLPKYRNPADSTQTWSGRGRQPLWFSAALKRNGVTAQHLLIAGAGKKEATAKKARAVKKAAKKATGKKAAKR